MFKQWSILLFSLSLGVALSSPAYAGAAKKGYWVASQSIEINAPADIVFAYTSDFTQWNSWAAWNKERDPTGTWAYKGDKATVGHEMSWDGPELGKGRMVLTKVDGTKLGYDLYFGKSDKPNTGTLDVVGTEGPVQVNWYTDGKLGLVGRLFRKKIEAGVGKDFADGLAKLKVVAEADAVKAAYQAKLAAAEADLNAAKASAEAAKQKADALMAEATAADKAADDLMAAAKKKPQKDAAAAAKADAAAKVKAAEQASQEAAALSKTVAEKEAALAALKG